MFSHALKALRANAARSALIFTSLTVSVTAVFLITAIARGIIDSYGEILRSDGDLIVTQKGIADTFFSDVDSALLPKIEALEGVRRVSAMIVGASPVAALPIVAIYGVSTDRFASYPLIRGVYPREGEVIVGSGIAEKLPPSEVKVGNRSYRISGVFRSNLGFENGGVVMTLSDAGRLFHKRASMLFVDLDRPEDQSGVIREISALSPDIEVKSTRSFVRNYHQFRIIRNSADAISLIALLMGMLSIASILSVTILERKYEFGILRAMGIGRWRVVGRILSETLLLALSAYAAALGLSLAILEGIRRIPALQGYVEGKITPELAGGVFLAAMAMTLLGAMLPAWRAAGIDPIELMTQGSRA